jgi:L-ascorbate metabolism protein UlaG (beta-lactamase superfamily)
VVDLGVDRARIIGAQPDEPITIGGLTIHPVPACHGASVDDAYNFGEQLSGGLVRYLGFVFDFGGVVIYHAGDTLLYEDQADMLRRLRVQVALLPINGRDRHRELHDLVGNMDPRDAAHLAADAGCDLLIPMHHDMFPGNLGYPELLVQYLRDQKLDVAIHFPTYRRPFIYIGVSPRF